MVAENITKIEVGPHGSCANHAGTGAGAAEGQMDQVGFGGWGGSEGLGKGFGQGQHGKGCGKDLQG
eukprot:CAMPEP_0172592914 /NCGR_PEP_ID=MMETSP1068-20121228/12052_1 /TAXON_ID=35684 /ORGANISM="Pseudopedinella elastica, Strain CCMP716" /LENGTH=65 /DNA_ID=CAMNT_0013390193 /DNA_START=9 /DNA_END=203 /DNA_ORIENTATION=-